MSDPDDSGRTSDKEDHRAAERKQWRIHNRTAALGISLTFLAVGGALASAYFANKAVIASQNGAEQARRGADEAHRQADAAETQARLAAQALYDVQRAYLAAQLPNSMPSFTDPRSVDVSYANEGASAARNVVVKGTSGVRGLESKFPDISTLPLMQNYAGGTTLIPREAGKVRFVQVVTLNETQLSQLQSGQIKGFILGRIDYDDVFGRHHHSEFCGLYSFLGTGTSQSIPGLSCGLPLTQD